MTTSFLTTCMQCSNTIAPNIECPNCGFSEAEPGVEPGVAAGVETTLVGGDHAHEFGIRRQLHRRNIGISMYMKMLAGLFGVITAGLWFRFVFMGSVAAFIGIVFMTVISAVFGWIVIKSEYFFPVALNCPGCDERLDELGFEYDTCACCGTRLS